MKKCLVCLGSEVEEILDLGETAPANRFLTRQELCQPEPKYRVKRAGSSSLSAMEAAPLSRATASVLTSRTSLPAFPTTTGL